MSRNYETSRIKIHRAYTVASLITLLEVNQNTVSNWVRGGLAPSDERKPYVFRGSVVKSFLDGRRKRSTSSLRPGEFKCFGCKAAVFPELSTIRDFTPRNSKHMFEAVCPDCSASVMKISSQSDRTVIEDCRNPNTSRDRLHEEQAAVPACIVINEGLASAPRGTANDRVILEWQDYAERFETKTVDQHLASIRDFEGYHVGKDFKRITKNDAASFMRSFKERIDPDAENRLSRSTVAHRSAHLMMFCDWLIKQYGYKSLPGDLPGRFKLPKSFYASGLEPELRDNLTVAEAAKCLAEMPTRTLYERRQRAMFAAAFLGALRADTVISLRIGSIDVARRKIFQDATKLRTKNGKSLEITWFRLPSLFGDVVSDWITEITDLGGGQDDALFPPNSWLDRPDQIGSAERKTIEPMNSKHAIAQAFKVATDGKVSPHSAKNTIANFRSEFRLSDLERKAWSQNMGHDDEHVTRRYAKIPDCEVSSIMDGIAEPNDQDSIVLDVTDVAKIKAGFEVVQRLLPEVDPQA